MQMHLRSSCHTLEAQQLALVAWATHKGVHDVLSIAAAAATRHTQPGHSHNCRKTNVQQN